MKYAEVEKFCLTLPGATLSIQWGSDHVYKVGGKMFAAMGAPEMRPQSLSFKTAPESFAILTKEKNIIPAPYLARAQWVQLVKLDVDGFECDVLRGATKLLSEARPVFVMELAPYVLEERGTSLEELLALFAPHGYRFLDQDPSKPAMLQFLDGGIDWVAIDRDNRSVFVPHVAPNAVYQFRLDGNSGMLTEAGKAPGGKEKAGPRHLAFHPTTNIAFTSDEQGSSITAYRYDPATGLTPYQTLST